jgi:hypothetical protein
VWEEDKLKQMAIEYYRKLFTREESSANNSPQSLLNFPVLDEWDRHKLMKPVTDEKVKRTVFDMKPLKAPGPDGFQAHFYKKNTG